MEANVDQLIILHEWHSWYWWKKEIKVRQDGGNDSVGDSIWRTQAKGNEDEEVLENKGK